MYNTWINKYSLRNIALRWFLITSNCALSIPTRLDFNFGLLALAHEHVHVPNVTDFPQAKLESEFKTSMMTSVFLLHNFGVQIIIFGLKT